MSEEEVLARFQAFGDTLAGLVRDALGPQAEAGPEDGVSETEESDSKKTSEHGRERKHEDEELALAP